MIIRRVLAIGVLLLSGLVSPAQARPSRVALPYLMDMMAGASDVGIGRPDAAVTVVEYTSILCVYCRQFHVTAMERLRARFIDPGQVRWIIREMPLRPAEKPIFAYMRCLSADARSDLLEAIFRRQDAFLAEARAGRDLMAPLAGLAVDRDAVTACIEQRPDRLQDVGRAIETARILGVSGTPTFFINGNPVIGAAPLEAFEALLEDALR